MAKPDTLFKDRKIRTMANLKKYTMPEIAKSLILRYKIHPYLAMILACHVFNMDLPEDIDEHLKMDINVKKMPRIHRILYNQMNEILTSHKLYSKWMSRINND